ncbi:DciA family protein [Candidatus Cardinium hertigii]|uniref:DUF721 domain-containing protein n=1 Tax=Candidatus Cardinium hertigii TaxID=247481 RepID=A0A2Z3L9C2_9BACT|nr:DciA family protein [Candidatus Cardinium hertigii]AWN81969.1 hypothetical protein DK880_00655 [Candidatus Cardinium hertigii]
MTAGDNLLGEQSILRPRQNNIIKAMDHLFSLKELTHKFLETSPFQKQLATAKVRAIWHTSMPTSIHDRTEKIYLHHNKVFLKINSAALRHELRFHKNKILKLFQETIPNTLDIVFL